MNATPIPQEQWNADYVAALTIITTPGHDERAMMKALGKCMSGLEHFDVEWSAEKAQNLAAALRAAGYIPNRTDYMLNRARGRTISGMEDEIWHLEPSFLTKDVRDHLMHVLIPNLEQGQKPQRVTLGLFDVYEARAALPRPTGFFQGAVHYATKFARSFRETPANAF